jgi:uncharacterized protein (DUF4415 family)
MDDGTFNFINKKSNARLLKDVFPEIIDAQNKGNLELRPVGRPMSENPKQPVSIRLSKYVVNYFKSSGKGWQTRINEVLQKHINHN